MDKRRKPQQDHMEPLEQHLRGTKRNAAHRRQGLSRSETTIGIASKPRTDRRAAWMDSLGGIETTLLFLSVPASRSFRIGGRNVELRALVTEPTLEYSRKSFRFALLEYRPSQTPDDLILAREGFWKRILLTRGEQGLNRN
jgi:hypothetical protein